MGQARRRSLAEKLGGFGPEMARPSPSSFARGVTWHDGKPFTSAGRRIYRDGRCGKKILNYGSTLQLFLTAVDTPDPQTGCSFRYERPMPLNLFACARLPGPRLHLGEAICIEIRRHQAKIRPISRPVGTGPFKFVKLRTRPIHHRRPQSGLLAPQRTLSRPHSCGG